MRVSPTSSNVFQITHSQETCLYPRLNAALRNHDMRSLAPFLPYMKLLLSALYQLPLTHARTYRGVKLELFEVISGKHFGAWQAIGLLLRISPCIVSLHMTHT